MVPTWTQDRFFIFYVSKPKTFSPCTFSLWFIMISKNRRAKAMQRWNRRGNICLFKSVKGTKGKPFIWFDWFRTAIFSYQRSFHILKSCPRIVLFEMQENLEDMKERCDAFLAADILSESLFAGVLHHKELEEQTD